MSKNFKKKPSLAVLGGSGMLASHFLNLIDVNSWEVKVLTRNRSNKFRDEIKVFIGSIEQADSIKNFFKKNDCVINFSYLKDKSIEENKYFLSQIVLAAIDRKVKRIIHVSTTDLYGDLKVERVDENTPCSPVSNYSKIKYACEVSFLKLTSGRVDSVVLRPSGIFGPGNEKSFLVTLINNIERSHKISNYLRSCLIGDRNFNLVSVDNVMQALLFLAKYKKDFQDRVFIISDDDDCHNNYRFIEKFIMQYKKVSYYKIKPISLPPFCLRVLLKICGKSEIYSNKVFLNDAIFKLGFKKKISFKAALNNFIVTK